MPCVIVPEDLEELEDIADKAIARMNDLTKLLCESCQIIEKTPRAKLTEGLADWWRSHKKSKGHIPDGS